MFTFYLKIAGFEARFHIINQLCSGLQVLLFIPIHFWRHREQDYISKNNNIWKKKINSKLWKNKNVLVIFMSLVYVYRNLLLQ